MKNIFEIRDNKKKIHIVINDMSLQNRSEEEILRFAIECLQLRQMELKGE